MYKVMLLRLPKKALPCLLSAGLMMVCAAAVSGAQSGTTAASKKVLIFSSYEPFSPGHIIISDSFRATLRKNSPVRVQLYNEFLDKSRMSESHYEAIMVGVLRQKYEAGSLDLICVFGVPALQLVLKHQAELFPTTRKIFCFFEGSEAFARGLGPGVSGIRAKLDYLKTLEIALALHPETEKVFVVSGSSGQDHFLAAAAEEEFRNYQGGVEFTYLSDLTSEEMRQQVATLPNNSIVIFLAFFQDRAGNNFSGPEGASLVASSSRVPVYGMAKTYLGSGIVGGSLIDFEAVGEQVGELGLRALGGQGLAGDGPQTAQNTLAFDERALRRWKISEASLPPGSVVQFKEPSFWELYRWYIAAVIGVGAIEALLIAGILANRIRRRRAEAALEESEEHLQRSQQAAQVGTWEWDIASGVSLWSEAIYAILGIEPGSVDAHVNTFVGFIHPDDRNRVLAIVENAIAKGEDFYDEFRIVLSTGAMKWLASRAHAERAPDGRARRMVGVNIDITERKRVEEALKQSEEKTRAVLRALPDIMFIQTLDGDYLDYHAKDTKDLFVPPEAFLGKNMSDVMPPELAEAFLACFRRAKETGEPQVHEYSLVVQGETRWYEARIIHTHNDQLLSIVRDVTERKRAEEARAEAFAQVTELKSQLEAENIYLKEEIGLEHEFNEIVGKSEAIKKVLLKIEQITRADTTVLILGETGTGKELVASAIHRMSLRDYKPMVKVNCATLPATLIESELFGHEKGAFTSATARQLGRFELANGGTIFLDEIGDLPLELQGKLLRVLQEGEFERLGSGRTIKVNVRVIAATNRNLPVAVQQGHFREDLWYRLNVFPISVPPLRERKEDIPLLVEAFINKLSKEMNKTIKEITPATMRELQDYSWPGNVRELANVIERAMINTTDTTLRLADRLDRPAAIELPPTRQTLEDMERQYILRILEETGWRIEGQQGAAKILGLNPSTLRTRMAKLRIQKPANGAHVKSPSEF